MERVDAKGEVVLLASELVVMALLITSGISCGCSIAPGAGDDVGPHCVTAFVLKSTWYVAPRSDVTTSISSRMVSLFMKTH